MHARHYSPRTVLYLIQNGEVPEPGPEQRQAQSQEQSRQSQGLYLQLRHPPTRTNIAVLQMPQSATAYAARLYDVLHQADNEQHRWIAVDLPPDTPEWEAVHDRLKRAATKE
jgi:L-threonylcarbamoyladenylate synthase